MCFLNGNGIRKALTEGRIKIESLVEEVPFSAQNQVTEDAVDLRLHPCALKYRPEVKEVDFLKDDMDSLFTEIFIRPKLGYLLEPGQMIFGQTLEIITFPDNLIGLIFTRATFAQLGLMVTCDSPKFAVGHNWAFSMQISNCGPVAIRLHPYSAVAQMLVANIEGGLAYPKTGKFYGQIAPRPPRLNQREKSHLQGLNPDIAERVRHLRDPADSQ